MARLLSINRILIVICLALLSGQSPALPRAEPHFKAVAFDYFVIFDPNSVIPAVEAEFPGRGAEFVKAWRSKQFEYCFLRSITARHDDFFKVTEDALVYTAEAMKLDLPADARARLLDTYLALKPWPDAIEALRTLKASGLRIITIANFSPKMLRANADRAGITDLFDDLLSTEVNGTYKPDARAYELGIKKLNLKRRRSCLPHLAGGMPTAQRATDIRPTG